MQPVAEHGKTSTIDLTNFKYGEELKMNIETKKHVIRRTDSVLKSAQHTGGAGKISFQVRNNEPFRIWPL